MPRKRRSNFSRRFLLVEKSVPHVAAKIFKKFVFRQKESLVLLQGGSEGISSVAFEVIIINCLIYFINLFIFNCLTSNINIFIFNLFDVKFLFSENHIFHKQKKSTVYGRASLVSDFKLTGKMMTCYFRGMNKFLRYRTQCKSILKCGFPAKGMKLTTFILFEVLGVPQLLGILV